MLKAIIVVPCFNEAERLPEGQFVQFSEAHPEIGFCFVDDGSTDATRERLAAMAAERPEVFRCHSLGTNQGKAEAVRQGIHLALAEEPAYVGFWDADLATPHQSILEFVRVMDSRATCEVLIGARVALMGHNIQRNSLRHYAGRVFATAASLVLGFPIYDTQCGAKMFRCSETTASLFREPFIARWTFDVEIVARLFGLRGRDAFGGPESVLVETPLEEWVDVSGSKIRISDFPKSLLELWRIRSHYPLR